MQKLNKKLFADFKSTPITRKIAFIQNNAEILIKEGLFKECFNQLEYSGKDLLLKKNGEAKYKEFEIERKKLANLPQEIEKRKKTEQVRQEEKRNEQEQFQAVKKMEVNWLERYNVFITGLTERLVSGLKITHHHHWAEFEELKESKPQGLMEFKLNTYPEFLRKLVPYVDSKNERINTRKEKLDQNKLKIKITKWVGGFVATIAISIGVYGYFKKSNEKQLKVVKETHMTYDSNGQLTGVEEKNYQGKFFLKQ